jgi:surface carbohydrate biosynthesis protein
MGVDILIPQVGYYERDSLVLYNVLYHLERLGFSYKIVPYFDYTTLDRYKPKALFMTDAHGSIHYVHFAKYAKEKGILTISLSSESNQTDEELDMAFWGHNAKKINYIDLRFVWNKKIKRKILKKYPDYQGQLEVSGAIGFDKYFWLDFVKRDEFLKKYKKEHFKKVVTYAGWLFGIYIHLIDDPAYYPQQYGMEELKKRERDYLFVKETIAGMIQKHPDVLFILKRHPGKYEDYLEILDEYAKYDNVLIFHYEENIYDLLNVSDLWLSYESTTSIEAWIMKKVSIQMLPTYDDKDLYHRLLAKYHSDWYKGNLVANSLEKLSLAISEYYEKGHIAAFDSLEPFRTSFLKAKTEKLDGLNGYRTACMIRDFLKERKYKKVSPKIRPMKAIIPYSYTMGHYAALKAKFIKKYDFFRSRYESFPNIEKNKPRYYKMLADFSKKMRLK